MSAVQGVIRFGGKRRVTTPRYQDTTREAAILKACLDYLRVRGIPSWRASTGAGRLQKADGTASRFLRFGIKGQSDILAVIPARIIEPGGILLAVETKSRRGKTSTDQDAFLEMVRTAGGIAIVAHSVEELAQQLDEALRVRRAAA